MRDVPGLRTSAPVEVSSPDAPDDVVVSTAGTPQIRIGDPGRTVSGLHRYVVTYTLDGVVRGGRLAWDAVGTDVGGAGRARRGARDGPMALVGAGCTTGTEGPRDSCTVGPVEPGHLVARIDALDAGDGATVSATTGAALGGTSALPAPPAAAPATQGCHPVPAGSSRMVGSPCWPRPSSRE